MNNKKYYIFKLDLFLLNIYSILIMVVLFLITKIVFDYNVFTDLFFVSTNWFLILFYYLIYAILHELLHALSYILNGVSIKNITFGIMLEKGIMYCLCKQNISKKNIMISSICPLFVIGFLTYFISIIFDLPLLLFLSIVNICGCVGDIFTYMFISKLKNVEFSEMDNPVCFAIRANYNVSKVNHYGIKYVGKKDNILRNDLNKFTISGASILIIIFIFIMAFI